MDESAKAESSREYEYKISARWIHPPDWRRVAMIAFLMYDDRKPIALLCADNPRG